MKRTPFFILIMTFLSSFGPLAIDMYLPALPEITRDLHTHASTVQLTLTFFMVGLAFGNVIIGTLSDSFGRRRPLIISLILFTLASLAASFAPTIELLIALRFIQGINSGAGIVLSRAIASDLYKGNALTKFFSTLILVNGLVPILAPMFGGFLLTSAPWRTLFIVLTLFGLFLLIGSTFVIEETLPEEHRTSPRFSSIFNDYKQLLTRKTFIVPILIQGLTYAMFFSYMAVSPFIMQNLYHLSAQQYSYLFAVTGFGLVFTAQVTGRLVDHVHPETLFRTYTAIQLVGTLIVILGLFNHWSLWILVPAFFLIVAPVSGIGTLGFAIAMNGQKRSGGSASSLVGLLQYFIGGIVTPLVGLAGENSFIPYVILVIVISILLITLHVINAQKSGTSSR